MPEVTIFIPLDGSPRDVPNGLGEDMTLWDLDASLNIVATAVIDRESVSATLTDIKINGVAMPLDQFTAIFGAELVDTIQINAEDYYAERLGFGSYVRGL